MAEMDAKEYPARNGWGHLPVLLFVGIVVFFLFTEHRAHLFGVLPYVLLLLCPLMHLLHGRHHGRTPEHDRSNEHSSDYHGVPS